MLAGIILTLHGAYAFDWTKMRTADFFSAGVRDTLAPSVHFYTDDPLDRYLTGPSEAQYKMACNTTAAPRRGAGDAWVRDTAWEFVPFSWELSMYFLPNGVFQTYPYSGGGRWSANDTHLHASWKYGTVDPAPWTLEARRTEDGMGFSAVVQMNATSSFAGTGVFKCASAAGWHTVGTVLLRQNSSVLGYTCSNVVAPAVDVAKWYWGLLGPVPGVVSASSLRAMTEFRDADVGWAAGQFKYGTGLQTFGSPGVLGTIRGHAGIVYGFNSVQGMVDGFGENVSISLVANGDSIATAAWLCPVLDTAARALRVLPADRCAAAPTLSTPLPNNASCHAAAAAQAAYPVSYTAQCVNGGRDVAHAVYLSAACAGTPAYENTYPSGQCLAAPGMAWSPWYAAEQTPFAGADAARYVCRGGAVVEETYACPCLHNHGPPQ